MHLVQHNVRVARQERWCHGTTELQSLIRAVGVTECATGTSTVSGSQGSCIAAARWPMADLRYTFDMQAAVYTRISDDSLGTGLGVARQEADCRALAERLGWQVAEVYSDNDQSAFNGTSRPQYLRMLADLEA